MKDSILFAVRSFCHVWVVPLALHAPGAWADPSSPGSPQSANARYDQIANRVLVSIDQTPYTQRQLTVHLLVKEILRTEATATSPIQVSETNWSTALDTFITDMIDLQETQRRGDILPPDNTRLLAVQRIRDRLAKESSLQRMAHSLDITDEEISRTLASIAAMEQLRTNRRRDRDALSEKSASEGPKVRLYDGAKAFRPMTTP